MFVFVNDIDPLRIENLLASGSVMCSSMFLLRVLSILRRGMGFNWHGDAFGKVEIESRSMQVAVNIHDQ